MVIVPATLNLELEWLYYSMEGRMGVTHGNQEVSS